MVSCVIQVDKLVYHEVASQYNEYCIYGVKLLNFKTHTRFVLWLCNIDANIMIPSQRVLLERKKIISIAVNEVSTTASLENRKYPVDEPTLLPVPQS